MHYHNHIYIYIFDQQSRQIYERKGRYGTKPDTPKIHDGQLQKKLYKTELQKINEEQNNKN